MWRLLRTLFAAAPSSPTRPEYVHEPPTEFGLAAPPQWVLVWTGWVLPNGRSYRGRLALWEEAGRQSAQVEHPVSRTQPVQLKSVAVPKHAEAHLRSLLRDAFLDGLVSIPEESIDGFPLEVTIHHRDPYQGIRARCNLGDALCAFQTSGGRPGPTLAEMACAVAEKGLAPLFQLGFLLLELSLAGASESGEVAP